MITAETRATDALRRRPENPASPADVVEAFLDRLGSGQHDRLEELLAPDVWMRALLTREVHEATTARETAEAFSTWVGGAAGSRMVESEHRAMAGRRFLRYRFVVRPYWEPERWHVIEQAGFCKVHEGRITRFDLACTGYFPVEAGMEEVPAGLVA